MTDLATGLYAHGAIMAGLLQKSKTGKGMHIDCNLLSSQVSKNVLLLLNISSLECYNIKKRGTINLKKEEKLFWVILS